MNEPQAFLNGIWIAASEAKVSVGDAGFVLGTSVTEQVRTFGGELFRLDRHLARLEHSLQIVGVEPEITLDRLGQVARELAAKNHRLLPEGDDLGLSIFITPGAYPTFSEETEPTVCMHTYPLPFRLWAQKYQSGQSLVTGEVCQVPARCWPPELKCRSRMHYYLADRRANGVEEGARALLLDEQGYVSETSTANIVVFKRSEGLISPPPEKILPGISLRVIFELAAQLGVPVVQRDLLPADLAGADEVFLGGTSLCMLPVTRLDGRPIGDGRPGEMFRRLLAAWSELVGVDIIAQAVRFSRRQRS